MTTLLVIMAFMQGYSRSDWYTPSVVVVPDMASCRAAGDAIIEMEKRTTYRCVQVAR